MKRKFTASEITFTALMVFAMALPISIYNHIRSEGKIDASNIIDLLGGLVVPYLFAFSYELILVKPLTQIIAKKITVRMSHKIVRLLIFSGLMVTMMCTTMTLFITLYTSASSTFLQHWIQLFLYTYPFTLCWQLLIAGPLIRKLHRQLYPAV